MDAALQRVLYQASLDSPGAWLMKAFLLKRAAEEIDYFEHQDADIDTPEGDFRFMLSVYNLLLGLSFENLLKGIVVARRGSAGSSGVPDKDLTTHEINKLLDLVDQTDIPFSAADKETLLNLENYVVWAGRYPFPKRASELVGGIHTSQEEHDLVIVLWVRLFEHLKSIGWIMKGGDKLWTDSSKNRRDA